MNLFSIISFEDRKRQRDSVSADTGRVMADLARMHNDLTVYGRIQEVAEVLRAMEAAYAALDARRHRR